ncbi:hypothetical protein [Pseudomonas muyukensis]|uniref:hypothetical protein n=1 Tax=Pseudomonas muyukensis TaxID=2842357 RepID=UPI003F5A72E4
MLDSLFRRPPTIPLNRYQLATYKLFQLIQKICWNYRIATHFPTAFCACPINKSIGKGDTGKGDRKRGQIYFSYSNFDLPCLTARLGKINLSPFPVVVGVLQALQRQVASNVGDDLVGVGLGAFERGIPPAEQAGLVPGIQGRFRPGGAIALLVARAFVGIGKDAQARATRTDTDTGADGTAAAAVLAVQFLRIGRGFQQDVALGFERQVVARLELAALHTDIAARGITVGKGTDLVSLL